MEPLELFICSFNSPDREKKISGTSLHSFHQLMRLYCSDKHNHNLLLLIFLISGNSVWLLLISTQGAITNQREKERYKKKMDKVRINLGPFGVKFEGMSCKSRNN